MRNIQGKTSTVFILFISGSCSQVRVKWSVRWTLTFGYELWVVTERLRLQIQAQSRAAAPLHLKELVEVVWTSDQDPPGGFLWRFSRQTQNISIITSSGLGTPQDPPSRTGNRCWGDGCLDCLVQPAVTSARPRIRGRKKMDGCFFGVDSFSYLLRKTRNKKIPLTDILSVYWGRLSSDNLLTVCVCVCVCVCVFRLLLCHCC